MIRGALLFAPLLLCLAAADGALAQTGSRDPATDALEPLPLPPVPPKAPARKSRRTKAKPLQPGAVAPPLQPVDGPGAMPDPGGPAAAPAAQAPPGATDGLLALSDLPIKPAGYVLGLYRLVHPGPHDDPTFAEIERVLRSIAEQAPNVKSVTFMSQPPKACDLQEDACFALLGAFQQLDLIEVGSLAKADNGLVLSVRLIDVASGKRLTQAQQIVASTDPLEIKSWAEALGCKLLIPGGCKGSALIDLDLPEMQIVVDNTPLPRTRASPERIELPVGTHRVRITVGQRTSLERTLAVLRDPPESTALYGRQLEQGGLTLFAAGDVPTGRDGRPAVPASDRPALARRRWTRTSGLAAVGLGVAAAAFGIYELQHGRSLTKDANAAFDANGGYYRSADVDKLNSARSANNTGKVATLLGAGLAAAGAVLYFAF
jgi:hypothetical protein